MELTRKITLVVFAVAAAVGIAGHNNCQSSLFQQQTADAQTVQQALRASETPPEKQAKLAAMEAFDQSLLAANGYKATARLDYGICNGNAPTGLVDPGLHYHSTSTCIEYSAIATSGASAVQHVHIYVQHHGVSGDVTNTKFTAVQGPALPTN